MKKYFNLYTCLNLVLAICTLVLGGIYCFVDGQLLIKTLASASFVLTGIIGLFYAIKNSVKNLKFTMIMVVGLLFAMLGDILLELNFIIGALFFAIGHIFYFIAYCTISKFTWFDLIPAACIFIPALLLLTIGPWFNFGGIVMQVVCIFYALIISCMVGKSIMNFIKTRSMLALIIMIGSILFFISDFVLVFNVFSDVSASFSFMCICTYYPAECILALSLLIADKTEPMKKVEKKKD